jgi:hypothetical protein
LNVSLGCFYSPPQTPDHYKLDPPLCSDGSLAIGYGAAGWAPISFYLPPGQDVDLGFLKIFLSTTPNDLSHIQQPSPPSPGPHTPGHRKAMAVPLDMPTPSPIQDPTSSWGTIIIPIRQRRPHVPPLPLAAAKHMKSQLEENRRLKQEASNKQCRHEEEIARLREEIMSLKCSYSEHEPDI